MEKPPLIWMALVQKSNRTFPYWKPSKLPKQSHQSKENIAEVSRIHRNVLQEDKLTPVPKHHLRLLVMNLSNHQKISETLPSDWIKSEQKKSHMKIKSRLRRRISKRKKRISKRL